MKSTLALVIFLTSLNGFSQQLSEKELEDSYIYQCGSLEQVVQMMDAKIEDLTDEDKNELIESRQSTVNILRNGKKGVADLIDQGSKSDTGAFGALLTCGVLVQISDKIKNRGCLDLSTNESLKGEEGLDACRELIKLANEKGKK